MGKDESFKKWSRKEFIYLSTMGIASLALPLWFGGCEQIEEAIRNRPMRRYIRDGSPELDDMIAIYKEAVNIMKSLPSTDKRNWDYQANIHYYHCSHRNWFFFPWHRAYLYYFETICRKLTGENSFALPYWNWSLNDRKIPSQFWGSTNPLYESNRIANASFQFDIATVGETNLANLLGYDFISFAVNSSLSGPGQVESGPHNHIHSNIGGIMSTFHSPLDPIFYCHHSMVDYMWAVWNINCGNENTSDPNWKDHTFNNIFVDWNGDDIDTVSVLGTIALPLITYKYELSPPYETICPNNFNRFTSEKDNEFIAFRKKLEEGVDIRMEYKLQTPIGKGIEIYSSRKNTTLEVKVGQDLIEMSSNPTDKNKVLLSLEDIKQPIESNFFVRVYVNMPEATKETSTDNVHYAGSFAFFFDPTAENHHGSMNNTFIVDLTRTMKELKKAGERTDSTNFTITFIIVPSNDKVALPDFSFFIKEIKLGVGTVIINNK